MNTDHTRALSIDGTRYGGDVDAQVREPMPATADRDAVLGQWRVRARLSQRPPVDASLTRYLVGFVHKGTHRYGFARCIECLTDGDSWSVLFRGEGELKVARPR